VRGAATSRHRTGARGWDKMQTTPGAKSFHCIRRRLTAEAQRTQRKELNK
jgi:hypothetical protein